MQQMMALPKWRAVVMVRTMSIFAETVKPLVTAKPIKLSALAARFAAAAARVGGHTIWRRGLFSDRLEDQIRDVIAAHLRLGIALEVAVQNHREGEYVGEIEIRHARDRDP